MTALETDRRSFLRAICEHPADDVARLVYADWLEENGERERAAYIRTQVEEGQLEGYTPDVSRVPLALDHDFLSRVFGPSAELSEQTRWFWTRGFVWHIELSCAEFMREGFAAAIFARHPVTSVTLTDRESHGFHTGFRWGSLGPTVAGSDFWQQHRDGVPREIWWHINDSLKPMRLFEFETRTEALAALSAACVSYGRSLASLPPLHGPA